MPCDLHDMLTRNNPDSIIAAGSHFRAAGEITKRMQHAHRPREPEAGKPLPLPSRPHPRAAGMQMAGQHV